MATPAQIAAARAKRAAGVHFDVYVNPGIAMLESAFTPSIEDLDDAGRYVDDRFRLLMSSLYESEGASGGMGWKPLTEKYLRRKASVWSSIKGLRRQLLADARNLPRHYLKGAYRPGLGQFKILQLTRRLRMSLTSRGAEHILETGRVGGAAFITMGTRVPYAVHHWTPGRNQRNPIQRTPQQDRELGAAAIEAMRRVFKAKVRALAGARSS